MFIFSVLIIVSLVFYVYYKVAILKDRDPVTQLYFNAMSRVCLGSFLLFFAINQYLLYGTRLSLFIGIIFIVLGSMQVTRGIKEAKHYKKEYRRLHSEHEA